MRIVSLLVLAGALGVGGVGRAEDRTAAKVSLQPMPGRPPMEVWLTRSRGQDGSLVVKLIASGVGPRPQALTIYARGGDEDGPGDDDVRGLSLKVFDLPKGVKAARVDFSHRVP